METLDLTTLRPGDLVYRSLDGFELFDHYGCYAGRDAREQHWFFEHGKGGNARLTQLADFSKGYSLKTMTIPDKERPAALARMRELLRNSAHYDALNFNCEHAANYIATGARKSSQVNLCLLLTGLCILAWALVD